MTTPQPQAGWTANILKDYRGVLQADAFGGYDGIFLKSNGKILEAACCAHARRKFFEVRETAPALAHQALAFFNRLYAIEHDAETSHPTRVAALREAQSVPIPERHARLFNEQLQTLRPKSSVTGAIKYSLKNWDALCRFTTDGNIWPPPGRPMPSSKTVTAPGPRPSPTAWLEIRSHGGPEEAHQPLGGAWTILRSGNLLSSILSRSIRGPRTPTRQQPAPPGAGSQRGG